MHAPHTIILGKTLSTDESVPLLLADRRRHAYIVGQTGTGKTGLLLNMMRADLSNGAGFCFLDPHGDAGEEIAAATPAARMKDVIYLDPSDPTHSFAYNPLAGVAPAERAMTASNIVSAFKNIWSHSWGPQLEFILTNALRLLLATRDETLIGIPRLFADESYRQALARRCDDPLVKFYWLHEYASYDQRQRNEKISSIQNKVGVLLSNPFIRSILCQNASTLDIAGVMNTGKVLIVNLAKGNLGAEPSHLLGALLISGFAQAAEARRSIPEQERRDFTIFVDEFQNFATESFATILSEARKWRLSMVAVNQHITQLPESLRHAVFGNAGTIIAFRVSAQDAHILGAELGMGDSTTLRETSNYHAWVRLMQEGTPREPHIMRTLPPHPRGTKLKRVIALARARYMVPRSKIDARIETLFAHAPARRHNRKAARRNPDAASAA